MQALTGTFRERAERMLAVWQRPESWEGTSQALGGLPKVVLANMALTDLVAGCAGPGDTVGITGMGVFPAPVHQALVAALPGVAFDDAGPMLDAIKLVKSEAEIALLREASRISDEGMRAGLDMVAEGALETVCEGVEHRRRSVETAPRWNSPGGARTLGGRGDS